MCNFAEFFAQTKEKDEFLVEFSRGWVDTSCAKLKSANLPPSPLKFAQFFSPHLAMENIRQMCYKILGFLCKNSILNLCIFVDIEGDFLMSFQNKVHLF